MKLAPPPGNYTPRHEIERNRQLEQADRRNVKAGQDWYVGASRIILTAPNGELWAITVSNGGTLSATSL